MRARLVVFPIKGRNWCFTRSIDRASADSQSSSSSLHPTLKGLWNKLSSEGRSMQGNAELVVDFVSDKMNIAWINLEKAPTGSFKNKIHSLGLKLLSRVKPSEIFLKSVSKDIMKVLPLPNVPFFWVLFRAYSHWRALKGSERLLLLVSDCSQAWGSLVCENRNETVNDDAKHTPAHAFQSPWVLQPSEELVRLLASEDAKDGVNSSTISSVCDAYHLSKKDVLKYKDSQ